MGRSTVTMERDLRENQCLNQYLCAIQLKGVPCSFKNFSLASAFSRGCPRLRTLHPTTPPCRSRYGPLGFPTPLSSSCATRDSRSPTQLHGHLGQRVPPRT